MWFVVVAVAVVVAVVGVGGRDPPILYITTPDRPPLRLLYYDTCAWTPNSVSIQFLLEGKTNLE